MKKFISIAVCFFIVSPTFAAYRKKKPWGYVKPPFGTPIDWNNPITQGLTHIWIFNEGAGTKALQQWDYTHNGTFDTNASGILTWKPTPYGIGINRTNSLTANAGITFPNITTTTTFTLEVLFIYGGGNSNDSYENIFAAGNLTGFWIQGSSVHKLDFFYTTDHAANTTLVTGRAYHYVVSVNAGSVKFYLNGAADGTSSGAPSFVANGMLQDNGGGFVEPFTGTMVYERFWKGRALSASEAEILYQNPFAMFVAPSFNLINQPPAVAGNVPVIFSIFPGGTGTLIINSGGSSSLVIK